MSDFDKRRKSVIRWAGSKRTALGSLTELAPDRVSSYVEPFVGSGVVYFALQPRKAVLSDMNSALINFYNWLKSEPDRLHELSSSIPRTKEQYLCVRSGFSISDETIAGAAQFVYLNYNCFNGIFRTNKSGAFNVPFSGERTPQFPEVETFLDFSSRMKNATVRCCDFRTTIKKNLSPKNFYYIDPPYFSNESRVFREYGPKYFSEKDLVELSELLFLIDECGAKFMLSYTDSKLALKLFDKWKVTRIQLTRNVGGFATSRKTADELVVRNY